MVTRHNYLGLLCSVKEVRGTLKKGHIMVEETFQDPIYNAHTALALSTEAHLYYSKMFEDAASFHRQAYLQGILTSNQELKRSVTDLMERVGGDANSSVDSVCATIFSGSPQTTAQPPPPPPLSAEQEELFAGRVKDPIVNEPAWRSIFY